MANMRIKLGQSFKLYWCFTIMKKLMNNMVDSQLKVRKSFGLVV